jgi:hypothetical protein
MGEGGGEGKEIESSPGPEALQCVGIHIQDYTMSVPRRSQFNQAQ